MAKIYLMQHESGNVISTENPEHYSTYKAITAKEGKALQYQQSKNALLAVIKPGDTVYTILRKVSSSGMQRSISMHIIKDNQILCLDYDASIVTHYKLDTKGLGLVVKGCGMDMGFDLVYNLGCALWPAGTPNPHGTRNGEPDSSGGYALKQQWL